MDKEGCTVKWRNRSKEYRWSELKTRRIENNIKSCYTDCRKCAVISPYEIKRFRKKEPMSYFINILHWRDWSTFYIYLDSGKINDGKNKYEGGINESIFRGKIAQWGVTFDDVNLKKVKPWEEILEPFHFVLNAPHSCGASAVRKPLGTAYKALVMAPKGTSVTICCGQAFL